MKVTPISETVTQITFYGFSNCFLVRESDGFTLVDTSVSGCAGRITEAARDAGDRIVRILLTHAHGDHVGSLDKLHGMLGDVSVAISEREAPLLHKDLSLRPGEPQTKPRGGFPGANTRPTTHTLTEGELFGSLRCIFTPGHTPGHMSFLDERNGTLLAGDALISIGGLHTVCETPWYFPLPKMATWDCVLANTSARKLLGYQPAVIGTGHGRPVTNGSAELERALQ